MKKAHEKDVRQRIRDLDAKISQLDWWFLRNIKHLDWNEKINRYWVLTARRNDLSDRLRSDLSDVAHPDYSRINSNPQKPHK